jgi:hypothetical protein
MTYFRRSAARLYLVVPAKAGTNRGGRVIGAPDFAGTTLEFG